MFSLEKMGYRLADAMADMNNMTSAQLAKRLNVYVQTVNFWKRGDGAISFSNLIKVCNILNCTIDYIVGRNDSFLDFIPKECPPFYERLRQVMKQKKITRYAITQNTQVKDSYFVLWKRGSEPKIPSLIILADYLDCTIDYLVGRDQ